MAGSKAGLRGARTNLQRSRGMRSEKQTWCAASEGMFDSRNALILVLSMLSLASSAAALVVARARPGEDFSRGSPNDGLPAFLSILLYRV